MPTEAQKNVWLIVSSKENWDLAVQQGTFGLNNSPGKLQGMHKGDAYVVYITKIGFVGWGTITESYYISERKIWADKTYRHRFGISPPTTSDKALPGAAIKDDLEFITEKSKWPVHFKGGLTKITSADFQTIKTALSNSKTSFDLVEKSSIEIGDELHNKILSLFRDAGFSIVESNKTKKGADIVVEDPLAKENTRIIIQCKNTHDLETPTYPSLEKMVDEYAHKVQKYNAVAAIIVISGYKVARDIDPIKTLEEDHVAIWTDDVIEYYQDLADKISGFSKHQILGDLGVHARFDNDREFDAIKIQQNKYSFYVLSVDADWLLRASSVLRRINYSGKVTGYQRLLNKTRITKDIPKYLEEDWIFPNAIICTTKNKVLGSLVIKDGKIKLPSRYGMFWLVDGQHRLYGFSHSNTRLLPSSKLLLSVIDTNSLGEDAEAEQAEMFVNLNLHAKRVEKKLIIELHNVLGIKEPAVQIVFALAEKPVFKDAIRGYSDKTGNISLAAFADDQSLKTIVSRYGYNKKTSSRAQIEDIIEKGTKDLAGYFSRVEAVFSEEWSDSNYILKTDRGIKGLLALYLKILDSKPVDLSYRIEYVLKALKQSNIPILVEDLRSKYLGAGGGKEFADVMGIYISKNIPGFDSQIRKEIKESLTSPAGDIGAISQVKEWLKNLDGLIRLQQMHIDRTTFEFLYALDKQKVNEIRLIFGDIAGGEKNEVINKVAQMRKDGYHITLTRARKPHTDGGFFHTRWIGNEKNAIHTDSDLKQNALRGGGVTIEYIEWEKSHQIKEFDDIWDSAVRGYRGIKLDYDWNGEE